VVQVVVMIMVLAILVAKEMNVNVMESCRWIGFLFEGIGWVGKLIRVMDDMVMNDG
jgi:hypothetical protein